VESSASSPREPGERRGVSPIKAFLALLALAVIAGVVLVLTTSDSAPNNPSGAETATEPDYSLTNAEAIARFKELNDIRLAALRQRDESLLDTAFTEKSPAADRLREAVTQLRRDNVRDRTVEINRDLSVISSERNEIEIRQEVLIRSRFVDSKGRDVTSGRRKEIRIVRWTLRQVGTDWLIFDGLITSAERSQ
jgi:hypothetical protein